MLLAQLKDVYHIDRIESANPNVVKCLLWVAILTLICSRRILRLIKNVNPKNAYLYTHLRWAKVFAENADRLLREVLESMDLKLDMITSVANTFPRSYCNSYNRRIVKNP